MLNLPWRILQYLGPIHSNNLCFHLLKAIKTGFMILTVVCWPDS